MKKRIAFFLLSLCFTNLVSAYHNLSAQVPESGSLALVALYNSTNGDGWTNNTNWLTGPVHTWYGVATTCTEWDTNVVCVARIVFLLDLYKNQLIGSIPPEIGNLTNLEYLDLGSNQLTGNIPPEIDYLTSLANLYIYDNSFVDLPDLSPIAALQKLQIQDNQFTFEDIEPNVGGPTSLFIYSPQDSVGSTQDTTASLGDSLTLKVSVGGTANLYQWMKDGLDIPGANDSLYTIPRVTFADSGSYICRITNTIATELTLYSKPINVTL